MEGSAVTGSSCSLHRTVASLLMDINPSSKSLESSSSSSMKCLEPETERRLAIRGWKAVEPTASKWNQKSFEDRQQRSYIWDDVTVVCFKPQLWAMGLPTVDVVWFMPFITKYLRICKAKDGDVSSLESQYQQLDICMLAVKLFQPDHLCLKTVQMDRDRSAFSDSWS